MNKAQLKWLAVFSLFAIIGFGPISPGCLIGMFIVLMRPVWFWDLTQDLYQQHIPALKTVSPAIRVKAFAYLLTLFLIDIAPVPVTPVIAFAIILIRPAWFYRVVVGIYSR